jgi:hypothetical protein
MQIPDTYLDIIAPVNELERQEELAEINQIEQEVTKELEQSSTSILDSI